MLRQFLKYAQQPLPDWGRRAETTTFSLKKIVENVSWNKSMLNSRFYWLVAFHYLEARQILLLEKIVKCKKDYENTAARMRRNLLANVKSTDSSPVEEDFIYASPDLGDIIIRYIM